MLSVYERHLILSWLLNLLNNSSVRRAHGKDLVSAFREQEGYFGIKLQSLEKDQPRSSKSANKTDKPAPSRAPKTIAERWQRLREQLERGVKRTAQGKRPVELRWLGEVQSMLSLSDDHARLLEFIYLILSDPAEDIFESCFGGEAGARCLRYAARALGMKERDARTLALGELGLLDLGLVRIDQRWGFSTGPIIDSITESISRRGAAKVREVLLGKPRKSQLDWEDFKHVEPHATNVLRILKGALAKSRRFAEPVHIMLVGEPGTGKTELAASLAKQLNAPLYAPGEDSQSSFNYNGRGDGRLPALRRAQRALMVANEPALLLCDEAEDELGSAFSVFNNNASRVNKHRALEELKVPVIWIANHASAFEDSVIRRMSYVIRMELPKGEQRARVWQRALESGGIKLPEKDRRELEREYLPNPALIASAARAAQLSRGKKQVLRDALDGMHLALDLESEQDQHKREMAGASQCFYPELTHTSIELSNLAQRLAKPGASAQFSLCLYGPPGSGKSAWARELARSLKLKVIEKRYSDLSSMFVGESEKAIRRAFREALSERALLILDEVDSLLASRNASHPHWQTTQVNEMLRAMEDHPLPFVATTNAFESLDEAAMRRFTFKIEFRAMDAARVKQAFSRFFNLSLPTGAKVPQNLTAGDFAVVARKARILAQLDDAGTLLEMLREESRARKGGGESIGFGS